MKRFGRDYAAERAKSNSLGCTSCVSIRHLKKALTEFLKLTVPTRSGRVMQAAIGRPGSDFARNGDVTLIVF